jgi:hypothetical protein
MDHEVLALETFKRPRRAKPRLDCPHSVPPNKINEPKGCHVDGGSFSSAGRRPGGNSLPGVPGGWFPCPVLLVRPCEASHRLQIGAGQMPPPPVIARKTRRAAQCMQGVPRAGLDRAGCVLEVPHLCG